jgi:Fe-S cluster assembly ATP-binding protein
MLKLKSVSAFVDNNPIITNVSLTVNAGEIHAILGPSGSGKSALAHLIQGNPFIHQTDGDIVFKSKNINKLASHKRSQLGIFTTFQAPPEIEGLTNRDFMKAIVETRKDNHFGNDLELAFKNLAKSVGLDLKFIEDSVNTCNRSLVDHKKGELLQALMLQPDLLIVDAIDIDLDEDSLTVIILMLKNYLEDSSHALIIISDNKHLLDELQPNYVHVMVGGEIKEQGTTELYTRILENDHS